MKEKIRKLIDARRDGIIDLGRRMIEVPTANPPGDAYPECVERLRAACTEAGLATEVIAPVPADGGPPSPSLLAWHGEGERTVYFHGHYDVVPAHRAEQFHPVLKGDKLFGRGATDMKMGLVAMLYAVRALREAGIDPDGRIALLFVPDEETGGARGSAALARAGRIGAGGMAMLTPEPTGGVIWHASRGAYTARIRVVGRTAHVGLQFRGINAFERMAPLVEALLACKREVEARQTKFLIEPEEARRSILMLGGRVEGGVNFNTVPADCSFSLERRFNPEEDLDEEKQAIGSILHLFRTAGLQIEVETLQEEPSSSTPADHPTARIVADTVSEVTGRAARLEMCPGLLETRFYATRGVPAFAYGPELLTVAHGPDEFVPIGAVLQCAVTYALAAVRLLQSPETVCPPGFPGDAGDS